MPIPGKRRRRAIARFVSDHSRALRVIEAMATVGYEIVSVTAFAGIDGPRMIYAITPEIEEREADLLRQRLNEYEL